MNESRQRRKMHDDEVSVADSLVRGLIDTQFPQWSGLALRRIPFIGTDNLDYRLGDGMGVRLPSYPLGCVPSRQGVGLAATACA